MPRTLPSYTIMTTAVQVNTTATLIVAENSQNENTRLFNNGSVTVYLGTSGVTTTAGYPLPAASEHVHLSPVALYGIVASSTADLRVLQEY